MSCIFLHLSGVTSYTRNALVTDANLVFKETAVMDTTCCELIVWGHLWLRAQHGFVFGDQIITIIRLLVKCGAALVAGAIPSWNSNMPYACDLMH